MGRKTKTEKQIEAKMLEELQRQFSRGMLQGSQAICGVILEKLKKRNGNNDNEIIEDIIMFCKTSLGLKESNIKGAS